MTARRESRVALITGATGGLGSALARRLAAGGWILALIARDATALHRLADELGRERTHWAVADVCDAGAMSAAVDDLVERTGSLDFVVANAGILEEGGIEDTELDSWTRVIETNLTGTFLTLRAALPAIRRSRGRLLAVSSLAGRRGLPGLVAYSAAKAGVISLTESLSAEVEPDGVGAHVLVLGPTATRMLDRQGASRYQLDPADVADTVVWLADLPPTVVLREVTLRPSRTPDNERRATAADQGGL